ncbi:MAG: c-type cytochrome, partial [Longimicrobiales bacterium]
MRGCGLFAAFALIAAALPTGVYAQEAHPGKATYDRWCIECHGAEGRGDGPAAATMLPRPRDFTQARYQIRTTPSGALPTDADILRVLENGMPGTAMPAWPQLSMREREDVIAYIKTFSRFFESEDAPQAMDFGSAPGASDEAIAEGRQLYDQLECWKCHGRQGRGDGTSAPTQQDDNGNPIRPANLAQNWHFNGGGTVEDIYARLQTGLDGTPMPSFSDLIEADVITDDQLWNIAHFVRSLSPEEPPEAHEVIRARLVAAVPTAVDDSAWNDVEPAYIPLVGQIIVQPRWFAPTVNTVWVQAMHDDDELALRLSWDDPSQSPDPAWHEWQALVTSSMEPKDDPPAATGALPDALAVQFAAPAGDARDLPYFLMGDATRPVYLWEWDSEGGVSESLARGIASSREPLAADATPVVASARFTDGRWQLLLRRALVPQD